MLSVHYLTQAKGKDLKKKMEKEKKKAYGFFGGGDSGILF